MKKKNIDALIFDSQRLEGNLWVAELLAKAAHGDFQFQKEADYAIPRGLKLHDEYGRAFLIAQAQWKAFAEQQARQDLAAQSVTEAFVLEFLRDALSYHDLTATTAPEERMGRVYPIHFQAGAVPVVIAPHSLGLDTPDPLFAISGTRKKSAAQLMQEYLNASPDGTWGLVSNGLQLRLMRHAASLTRPSFLEFDLHMIFSDARYADFSALWRLLHASRASAIWERWRLLGQEQGARVRLDLHKGVKQALQVLGKGFLQHSDNQALLAALRTGELSKHSYFQELLRLVYRCLFLFTIEERELLHLPLDENSTEAERQSRKIYAQGYSLRRLRQASLAYQVAADAYKDLWQAQLISFKSLAHGEPRLALPALGGLFDPEQCKHLDSCSLSNRAWLEVQFYLRWSHASGQLTPVDYRNMGPEELGSVYESLLELVPDVSWQSRSFDFVEASDHATKGNDRKKSGSYYTPDSLVQELIKSALDPVIADRIASQPENPSQALLSMTVVDPTCGSGHFLLAAARRLAEQLAQLRAPEGAVQPEAYRHALREVISHCIYGIDRNPLALELARMALWIEGYEPGRPLSFLDHHLVCGDALLGITLIKQLEKGIPDEAYKVISGDDKAVCNALKARNRQERKDLEKRRKNKGDLFHDPARLSLLDLREQLENLPDESLAQVAEKELAWQRFLDQSKNTSLAHAANFFMGAFLAPKGVGSNDSALLPSTGHLTTELFGDEADENHQMALDMARQVCEQARVLHWPLAFPKVFAEGGFDCILGNPPWERIKLQEEEFFANRHPLIAAARNKAERGQRIKWLSQGRLAHSLYPQEQLTELAAPEEMTLYQEFLQTRRLAEATSVFAHIKPEAGGRYPLTGVGDVNTYALFSETISQWIKDNGRAGFIVPTGIATDDSTKAYFAHLTQSRQLVSLFDFENREAIFSDVHRSYKFSLLTLGASQKADFAFYLTQTEQLHNPERRFTLSAEDFALINPNTLTCPVFRSRYDAELTRKIYRNAPVLIQEEREGQPEQNPWGLKFMAMLHMSNDSHLFAFEPSPGTQPLYEAKMIHQYDHRWATYDHQQTPPASRDVTLAEKAQAEFEVTPRYWVDEHEVLAKLAKAPRSLLRAWLEKNAHDQLHALANWVAASQADRLAGPLFEAEPTWIKGPLFKALLPDWQDAKQQKEALDMPLITEELAALDQMDNLASALEYLIRERSPKWLMGWRDITNATNERTVIASVVPVWGVGHTLPLFFSETCPSDSALLLANLNSLSLDYISRQKVGGTHLTYGYLKQFPTIPPEKYTQENKTFICSRIVELTYTSQALKDWAQELGYQGEPFGFDPARRALLRAELDAYYARLYGLSREDLRYILDPADVMGEDYPSETFRGLKKKEMKEYGEYRTGRLVLEAWDRLTA